jgi:5-methyltetrahydrofolate corrinoid/iron sulfur protein methyltransferase
MSFTVIAENINVMSKRIGKAMKDREAGPIRDLAAKLAEAGADYLDLNVGPSKKDGAERIRWIIGLVREVTDLPLFIDTTNVAAVDAGLAELASRKEQKKSIINSISAVPERMDALLPICKRHGAGMVALLWGPDGIPRDANERGMLAADLQFRAGEAGVDPGDLWYDPIVCPVTSQQSQVQSCTEFMQTILPELAPQSTNTCGLSNVSNCAPDHLRPIINQTYFAMLKRVGLRSAIVDPLDKSLMDIARGKLPEVEALVGRVMDGEEIELSSLSKEEADYVKTARVLTGKVLYSDSWLEL